jgi:uncharacterized protein
MVIKNAQRFFEIVAVIATGMCKFIFVDLLPLKSWYIGATCLFWIAYVVIQCRKDKSILKYWGFTRSGFQKTILLFLPFAALCVMAFVAYGLVQDTLIFNWHLVPVLLLYPLWGVIQQFLIVALIAGNLKDLKNIHVPSPLIVVVTSVIFSIVHYPSLLLIAATFVLALLYTPVYLRHKNLWALGIYHGWLACFFYFFVLGRDAWLEVINTL